MVIECCSQERTYSKFYGLIGERFAKLNRLWADLFEAAFAKYYDTIHRYETNRLRNIARFFGHLLSSNAIGWHVLSVVHLNEEETTSSSRIFIKILFQDLAEALGMAKLQERLKDDILKPSYEGLFPKDNPRNTRFSINYFTSIGMGAVTEDMREHLKNLPKPALPALPAAAPGSESDSGSSVSSYSSYTGSSRSYSRSRSPSRVRERGHHKDDSRSPTRTKSGPRRRDRSASFVSRSPSPIRQRRQRNTSSPRSLKGGPSRSYSLPRRPAPSRRPARSPSVDRAPRRQSPPYSLAHRNIPDRGRNDYYKGGVRRTSRSVSPPNQRVGPRHSYRSSRSPSPPTRPQRGDHERGNLSRSQSPPRRIKSPLRGGTRDKRITNRSRSRSPLRQRTRRYSSYSSSASRSPSRSPPRRRQVERNGEDGGRRRSRRYSTSPPRSPNLASNRRNLRASPTYDVADDRGQANAEGGKGTGRARAADYL